MHSGHGKSHGYHTSEPLHLVCDSGQSWAANERKLVINHRSHRDNPGDRIGGFLRSDSQEPRSGKLEQAFERCVRSYGSGSLAPT